MNLFRIVVAVRKAPCTCNSPNHPISYVEFIVTESMANPSRTYLRDRFDALRDAFPEPDYRVTVECCPAQPEWKTFNW